MAEYACPYPELQGRINQMRSDTDRAAESGSFRPATFRTLPSLRRGVRGVDIANEDGQVFHLCRPEEIDYLISRLERMRTIA
ncbi:hypothetical protein [Dactylosporangium sp. CA-139066]|uniref:hypothetical protein n=1 Tax=Dactylosporangium sp. CA-139066 TaxID=3239930 RepID=UPI003D8B1054